MGDPEKVESALSPSTEQRTAVLWGLEKQPEDLVEAALHAVMDRGLAMADGVNVARLHYDRKERWWNRGEELADASGAHVATVAHTWDGCVAAFAGRESFHLEFRLRGIGEPSVLLHERDNAYLDQVRTPAPAMALARMLFDLTSATAAQYCAFPVAGPWLIDEDWKSLLRPPFYPDFFLLPAKVEMSEYPPGFRTARLAASRLLATALPVKLAPHDSPAGFGDRDRKLSILRKCDALGEKYYDQMYETRSGTTGLYSNAKDAFVDAIATANELGLKEEARRLEARLENIKSVFRSQFS